MTQNPRAATTSRLLSAIGRATPGERRTLLACGAVVTVLVAVLSAVAPAPLRRLDDRLYDAALRATAPGPAPGGPVIVDVDDASLARVGQWPWPRYRIARLLDTLTGLGAVAVGLDVVFAEPDRTSLRVVLEEARTDLAVKVDTRGLPEGVLDNDRALAIAIGRAPVVLGHQFRFDGANARGAHCLLHPLPLAVLHIGRATNGPSLPRARGVVCNMPALAEAASWSGHIGVAADADGTLRRAPLLVEHEGRVHPSLALATLLRAQGAWQATLVVDGGGPSMLRAGRLAIPVDAAGTLLVRYRSPRAKLTRIPAGDVLGGRAPRELVEGRVVFVGTSATGLADRHATPVDILVPGVDVQAAIADNILRGDFVFRPAWASAAETLALLACGLLSAALLGWTGALGSLLGLVPATAGLWYGGLWALRSHGAVVSPLYPWIAWAGTFAVLTLVRYGQTDAALRRRGRHLEAVRAVTEEIVRELDLGKLLDLILRRSVDLVGAARGAIFLPGPSGDRLVPRVWTPDAWTEEAWARLGAELAAAVAGEGRGRIANDHRAGGDAAAPTATLAEPLLYRQRLVGVIVLAHEGLRRRFREGDRGLIALLGAHAVIAIENAKLFEAARRSEVRLRSLVENGLDVITVLDGKGAVQYASPSVQRVLGHEPSSLIGRPAVDFVHPEDAPAARRALDEDLAHPGSTASGELRVRHRDGAWVLLESVGHNLLDDPDVAGVVVSARDVTERRRTEEGLRRGERLAMMGQLLAGVAHELNNPLSVVLGRAELLGGRLAGTPLAAHAQKLEAAAIRCGQIVRNFLALARQRPSERQPTDLNAVVQEAVELLAYPLRLDGVEVTLALDRDVPAVWADPHELHQVVVNLVTNAHQAMREAAGERRLTLHTRREDEGRALSLTVADTGPGMSPEVLARVFEPFFTTKPAGEGTGLGLPLCQGIVEAHGGTITVDSERGHGARFVVTLPAQTPTAVAAAAEATSAATVTGKTILVVDDEASVADLVADILGEAHHVETALDGATALARVRERPWDVVFCDVRMPGLDGPALYREVARHAPGLERRFVFMTGDALSGEVRDFLESTAVAWVGKPFRADDIRRAVQQVAGV